LPNDKCIDSTFEIFKEEKQGEKLAQSQTQNLKIKKDELEVELIANEMKA